MPAAKAAADAAAGIERSSIVVAMARNGTEFGVRLSGTGDRWFTGPSGMIDGLYLPGYGPEDANPDIGDSTITETVGLGGFAMAAAPAIVRVRRRPRRGRARRHAADVRHHVEREPQLPDPVARLPRARRSASTAREVVAHRACCRSSTPASRTASREWARSAPGSSSRRWRRSSGPSGRSPGCDRCGACVGSAVAGRRAAVVGAGREAGLRRGDGFVVVAHGRARR